jgi:hypothetical protein
MADKDGMLRVENNQSLRDANSDPLSTQLDELDTAISSCHAVSLATRGRLDVDQNAIVQRPARLRSARYLQKKF